MNTLLLPSKRCEHCGSTADDVRMRPAHTNYLRELTPLEERVFETIWRLGGGEVPLSMNDEVANRDESLCNACDEENAVYWREMFAEANYDKI